MKESNDRSLKLSTCEKYNRQSCGYYKNDPVQFVFICGILTSASVDSGGTEGLPDNCLTDVGGNEERDTRAKTIALLEQLI